MLDLFQYNFIIRGLAAGLIIAVIAPLVGIFLVLRRYSLIADTLSHVSLAGVAIGVLLRVNPLLIAVITAGVVSLGIERLRLSKKIYGESALGLFLSGSLALAIVLMGLAEGVRVDLFSYLFGSIATVKQSDIYTIAIMGLIVITALFLFYKELVFVTFDEEAAQVSGISTKYINMLLVLLSSLTIAIAIPIIGALLISALMVIPVITALQFRKSFKQTVLIAEVVSLFSVAAGVIVSFYLNVATGGVIVLMNVAVFGVVLALKCCGEYIS